MILVQFMSENVLLMYSFKSFKVSSLTFRSSIHLKFIFVYGIKGASLAAQWLKKNPPANEGDTDTIPGSERAGEGTGNPFQYSCLGNPKERGTWQATVHRAWWATVHHKELDMT